LEEIKMGITKRRMEAEEGDINKDLRLCFKCGERIDIPDQDTRAWHMSTLSWAHLQQSGFVVNVKQIS
jgi:hypothetical protein